MTPAYPKIAQFKDVDALREHLTRLNVELPLDDRILTADEGSPLAEPLQIGSFRVGNRWCIHPMEGWDANRDGSPSELTLRRWRNFGASGAKLIWGGEAAAVVPEGRANPNQALATVENRAGLAVLLDALRAAHREQVGDASDLLVGLQLTHSGRFCQLQGQKRPRIAYHHALLDSRFGIDPGDSSVIVTDEEVERLIDAFASAARLAAEVGFQFVDIKACHGYLLHEFLSARSRVGRYGGDLAGRTLFLRRIIERIRGENPHLMVGVRLSVFDCVPYQTSRDVGQPMPYADCLPYRCGFGVDQHDPLSMDLAEPIDVLKLLAGLGVVAVNLSAGSPYYCPHLQRPAAFPPSDGYLPPEDPLCGVWRHVDAARRCKAAVPQLVMVGSAYSYLQDYAVHAAQAVARLGWVDAVGLGRMALAYPRLPFDSLHTGQIARKQICRTFSDCTTGPRQGQVSGCFPLDPYYRALPAAAMIRRIRRHSDDDERLS